MESTFKSYYKFIGDTDKGLGYVNGKTYALTIGERTWSQRTFGVLFGMPRSWRIFITSPIPCPYESWESFKANWEHQYDEISD